MEGTLYERIYNKIVDDIRSYKLKPGDRVPSEKELADEFGVSRITTKKAMEMLAQSGYIERIRGKGSYVRLEGSSQAMEQSHSTRPPDELRHRNADAKLIGLLIPDMTDSFGLRLFRAIEEQCSAAGYHLLIKLTNDKRELEEAAIRNFVKLGVDGLIVFPVHGEHYNGDLVRLVLDGFPIVLVDRYFKGIAACSVGTDNKKAAQELTTHLLDKGHKDIAFISTPSENTTTIEDRIQGFTNAMIQRGLILHPNHIVTNLQSTLPQSSRTKTISEDKKVLSEFFSLNPNVKAFVACEYNLALLLQQELKKRGETMAAYDIVCFDSPEESWGDPQFTAIRQNEEEMGRQAVDMLQIQWDKKEAALHRNVDHRFIYQIKV